MKITQFTCFGYCKICNVGIVYDCSVYLPKKLLICKRCKNLFQIRKVIVRYVDGYRNVYYSNKYNKEV